jgi:hypothetical protein
MLGLVGVVVGLLQGRRKLQGRSKTLNADKGLELAAVLG